MRYRTLGRTGIKVSPYALVLAFSPGSVGMGPLKETSFDDFETAVTGKLLPYVDAIREARSPSRSR